MIEKGTVFGNLTVVRRSGNDYKGGRRYICACQCGKEKTIYGERLLNGIVTSCGCASDERDYLRKQYETITLRNKALIGRIKELSQSCKTTPAKWVEEALEDWILKHRSNKVHRSELDFITEEVGDETYSIGSL